MTLVEVAAAGRTPFEGNGRHTGVRHVKALAIALGISLFGTSIGLSSATIEADSTVSFVDSATMIDAQTTDPQESSVVESLLMGILGFGLVGYQFRRRYADTAKDWQRIVAAHETDGIVTQPRSSRLPDLRAMQWQQDH